MSDHLAVLFNINIKAAKSPKPPHRVYVYKRANFDELNKSMLHSSEEFFASNPENFSVEENWSTFKSTLAKAINDYIPQRSSCSKYKLPWINPGIKRHMRKKDRLHKKALRTRNPKHWVEFKRERNLVSRLVKESHSNYLNNVIGPSLDENPKKFWSYIRTCKSEDNGIPPLRSGNKLCSTDKDKTEALNSYFHTVFT